MKRPGVPAQRGQEPESRILQRTLPATPASARLARVTARVACRAWRVPGAADHAVLVASELVTIALRHASQDRLILRVLMTPRRLRLEVHDPSGRLPVESPHEDECAVDLLGALTTRWGVDRPEAGASVWAEIALEHGQPAVALEVVPGTLA